MNWIKAHKILSAVFTIVILLVIVGAAGGDDKAKTENNTSPTNTQPTQQSSTQQQTTQPPKQTQQVPEYVLVGEFGTGGKAYLISPSDATVAKLTLIGKDLNKKFGSDDLARIGIYTDRAQAQIIVDDPLKPADLEGSAADAYDKAYVAQFNVNNNTGFKRYVIYLNGSTKVVIL